MHARHWLPGCLSMLSLLFGGCAARGDATRPIPTTVVHASRPARRVVVVLPGRGDDLAGLQKQQAAQIIQHEWPDADVVLTGLTMAYYQGGVATRRLHDEVIAPLQKQGHVQVWLAGISMGGMGVLMYDRDYPGQVDGMLLLSPYLGEAEVPREIRAAGGLAAWQPGPVQPAGPATYTRELWRYLRQWSADPARTRSVWLAYGADERLRAPIELMSPQLPAGHVHMLPGHHDWTLWRVALGELLRAAAPVGESAAIPQK
jgi:pimeloyl-ACP methyl ester carboxylesterase